VLQGRKDLDFNLSRRLFLSGAVTRSHALCIGQTLADSLYMLVTGLGRKHTSGENLSTVYASMALIVRRLLGWMVAKPLETGVSANETYQRTSC